MVLNEFGKKIGKIKTNIDIIKNNNLIFLGGLLILNFFLKTIIRDINAIKFIKNKF